MTAPEIQADRTAAHAVLSALMQRASDGYRQRNVVDARAGLDMKDLWAWLKATRWAAPE